MLLCLMTSYYRRGCFVVICGAEGLFFYSSVQAREEHEHQKWNAIGNGRKQSRNDWKLAVDNNGKQMKNFWLVAWSDAKNGCTIFGN